MKRVTSFDDFLNEATNPAIYKAPDGSKRAKTLEKVRELLKGSEEDKKKAYKLRDEMEQEERDKTNESIKPEVGLEEFAEERGDAAQGTVDSTKEKGGLAMLSHDHFKVKIPYYEKAASGEFNIEEFRGEYQDLLNELLELTSEGFNISQKDFQEILGKLEVLGELCIRNNDTSEDTLNEAKKTKKKKKAKKKTLSKETEAKIRKVANKKGYTFGSLKQEYIKGLGAFYSSGSRPGMTAHGWAMARVNKATPSKPWANVKRSKRKK